MRLIYTAIFYLAIPFIYSFFLLKSRNNPAYRQGFAQRMGWYGKAKKNPPHNCVLVHCASVGEVVLATPIIQNLLNQNPNFFAPNLPIVVTTMTPTGAKKVQSTFASYIKSGQVRHFYLPFDVPCAVYRFVKFMQPKLVIIIETEIWANLFMQLKKRGVPIIMANARISPRSLPKYKKFKRTLSKILAGVTIACQDKTSYARYVELGALPNHLCVMGNLKYDLKIPHHCYSQIEYFFAITGNRPVWVAGSTHAQEEELILEAHKLLQTKFPNLLLVLVPRHIERITEIEELISAKGLSFSPRTADASIVTEDVLLVDKIGELLAFYAIAKVAFVGGSLIKRGGHNPLEPLLFQVPVISGEYVFNFAEIYAQLDSKKAVLWIKDDPKNIAQQVTKLLTNNKLRQQLIRGSFQVLQANQGGLNNLLAILKPFLRQIQTSKTQTSKKS